MRRSPETLIKARFGDSGSAALLLCALSLPTMASAGATSLCDTRTVEIPDLEISVDDFTIDLVDLGSEVSVDLDIPIRDEPISAPAPFNVDEMLKQMFDRPDIRDAETTRIRSRATNMPVVELASPTIRTESPDDADEADSGKPQQSDSTMPAVSTRVPGLSEDELRRYRNKMYRTDI